MQQLLFHKRFQKQLQKLSAKDKRITEECLHLFIDNPFDLKLKNHPLQGSYKGCRSINIRPDLRAIYVQLKANTVEFVALGSHSQLYK
ncbi:MAG: type II toxin-antitoxin system mRNA interferase toxin, RelE/StbE family [Patescibacteria group bacterium]|jgi:YafQ family addiction module toxin component